jgi:uncharacterized protein (DUF1778 family)
MDPMSGIAKPHNKDHVISTRISRRVLERLARAANRRGVKVGDFVRDAALRAVEAEERMTRRES